MTVPRSPDRRRGRTAARGTRCSVNGAGSCPEGESGGVADHPRIVREQLRPGDTESAPTHADRRRSAGAEGSQGPLWDAYDVAMLDLDGVVYIGPDAVPGAPEHLARPRGRRHAPRLRHQQRLAARRPRSPSTCVSSGSTVADEDVVTSAQAAARVLAEQLPAGLGGVRHRRRGTRGGAPRAGAPAGAGPGRGARSPWSPGFHRRPALGDRDRRRDPGARRAALGRLQHRPDRADAGRTRPRQRRAGRGGGPVRGAASPWWPASRSRRCSRRRCAAWAASGRWWSATGWTPTSRAPTTTGYDSLLVMTGVTGLEQLVAARPAPAPVVRRGRPRRPGDASTRCRATEDGRDARGLAGTVVDGDRAGHR